MAVWHFSPVGLVGRSGSPRCGRSQRLFWAWFAGWSSGLAVAIAAPGVAAERIFVTYNILERSISIESLEIYAKTGVIREDLAAYAGYADPKTLAELRKVLTQKAGEIKPVTIAQFLYSPQGEAALKRLGAVIKPKSDVLGDRAIRSALILASLEPDGLTLLNFLKKFPTTGIKIDVEQSLAIVGEVEQVLSQSQKATQAIVELAQAEATTDPVLPPNQPDLRVPGPFGVQKRSMILTDPSRRTAAPPREAPTVTSGEAIANGRTYPLDIYLPQATATAQVLNPIPVIVISHGLGSSLQSFRYLANHLASHGFAVLVPQHPGSDSAQMAALLAGTVEEVSEPIEFANRPLDISYLLDEIERQAATDPVYRSLNLKQVGVVGQSFGGYTALALAGAPINFEQLQKACQNIENTFNISLFLQCRAQVLPQMGEARSDFRDPRIAAVMAMNPIDSAVMGPDSLKLIAVPTLIVAGSADTVAPAVFEQIQPFTWLTMANKYLVQLIPGTHFSVIGDEAGGSGSGSGTGTGEGGLPIPPEVIGPSPDVAQGYMKAIALAFFQTHIAQRENFRPYLTAAYVRSISTAAIRVDLVRTLTASQLAGQGLPRFQSDRNRPQSARLTTMHPF